jgi:hypothetical protein
MIRISVSISNFDIKQGMPTFHCFETLTAASKSLRVRSASEPIDASASASRIERTTSSPISHGDMGCSSITVSSPGFKFNCMGWIQGSSSYKMNKGAKG